MHKVITKIFTQLQSLPLQSMAPSWGSQQIQSASSQTTWDTNTHRWVNTITLQHFLSTKIWIKCWYYQKNVHTAVCLPNGRYLECLVMQSYMTAPLPSGEFWLVSYSWSVTSSITGPVEEAFGFGLLRMILLKEVVIISTYVMPVMLSFMTQLELTLDIPGASPIDTAPMDASGVFKQAVTPLKPCGRVEGFTSVTAVVDGEGLDWECTSGRWMGDFIGFIWEYRWDLPLGLKIWVGWGVSPAAITGQDGCNTVSHPMNFVVHSLGCGSSTGGVFGMSAGEGVVKPFSSYASRTGTPQKTSSLVKVRYHFTSSVSSNMPFANKWGPPPVGRLFCSTQYWRALVYTTTFSLGTSLMSRLAKIKSGGSIKVCQWRHGGAGGAWRVAFSASSSHNCCGSPKDTLTCLASSLVLSSPRTVDSSFHQLGVSHFPAFHWTHSAKSRTAGSGSFSLPLLSDVSGDPCRKEATVGTNSGSSPKSVSLPLDSLLPDGISGLAGQLTWWCPLFLPLSLDLQWSWLLNLTLDLKWALIWLSLSISSSKVVTVDSALCCTLCILVRLLSTELCPSQWGFLLLDGWESPGLGWAQAWGASSLLCGQSGIAANTSSRIASSPGGEPGNWWSLYTLR